jgi:hypothetical protein
MRSKGALWNGCGPWAEIVEVWLRQFVCKKYIFFIKMNRKEDMCSQKKRKERFINPGKKNFHDFCKKFRSQTLPWFV